MSKSPWKKSGLLMGALIISVPLTGNFLKASENSRFRVSELARPIKDIPSLKTVKVPGPSDEELQEFIRDKKAVLQLGKALFWETKVGSDNKTACASCHFHAGSDPRRRNQLTPGLLAGDEDFEIGGPNHLLLRGDFPFRRKVNDVASSQGVVKALFSSVVTNGGVDQCEVVADDIFHGFSGKKPVNTRRVEPRHSPSVINAVFNFRNFWDGRANNIFNGIDPFGLRNPGAYVWKEVNGTLKKVKVALPFSSLASQASGPPLNDFEMTCRERMFFNIGHKLLKQKVLSAQDIAPSDSVLSEFASYRPLYEELIKKGFKEAYWKGGSVTAAARPLPSQLIDPPELEYPQMEPVKIPHMEINFSLFFSLAIQLYESTLVSDDTPFDQYAEGNLAALTEQQKRGFDVFKGQGRCINCHDGPEFTNASVQNVLNERLEKMEMADGGIAVYDNGFYNIGVRPTREDLGVGGTDPLGNPLSETRMVKAGLAHLLGNDFNEDGNEPGPDEINRTAVDGAFKTPSLRNTELTGPYFHNGGKSTLMQVVEFYNRGGDFAKENIENLDPDIQPLGLSKEQKNDLVSFLMALTDERVRFKRAPFDHPSLCFPNGHVGNSKQVVEVKNSGVAKDRMECLSAVGAEGVLPGNELRPFMNLSPFARK